MYCRITLQVPKAGNLQATCRERGPPADRKHCQLNPNLFRSWLLLGGSSGTYSGGGPQPGGKGELKTNLPLGFCLGNKQRIDGTNELVSRANDHLKLELLHVCFNYIFYSDKHLWGQKGQGKCDCMRLLRHCCARPARYGEAYNLQLSLSLIRSMWLVSAFRIPRLQAN